MGKNRTDCPACGRPLKYDEASNCMVCPAGHYSEPVKNDINIDSHDQVVNNYYQGPASHQTDNRGSYEQMVQRLEAFVADDDDDGINNTLADLRDSYPQTYFGKLINIWFNNQITTIVFNPVNFASTLSGWGSVIASMMKEDLSDDDSSGITHLSYEVAYRAFKKLDELGIATKEQKNVVKQGSDIEVYLTTINNIITFIRDASSSSIKRLIKYDFEEKMANTLDTCYPIAQKLLKNLCNLDDDIRKYVNVNYTRTKEYVANKAVSDSSQVVKPTQKHSGFVLTLACVILQSLTLICCIVPLFIQTNSSSVGNAMALLFIAMFNFVPINLILSWIKNKVAKWYEGYFFWVNIAGAIAALVALCILMNTGSDVAKAIFAIIAAGCDASILIRNAIKLPKMKRLSAEIKAANNSYLINQVAAEENYDQGIAGAKFESYADMIDGYSYDFSKWNK